MIGSGSFACAMLHVLSGNVMAHDEFHPQVKCWVHDAKAEFEVRRLPFSPHLVQDRIQSAVIHLYFFVMMQKAEFEVRRSFLLPLNFTEVGFHVLI
jgi:hypothetical protein